MTPTVEERSVVVYTPANMNAIDGSSVWAQTVTLALASLEHIDVSLLLSHTITTDRLLGPLLRSESVKVIDPFANRGRNEDEHLTVDEAAGILAELAAETDTVLVRGSAAAQRLATEPALRGKLWPYLTDIPQHVLDVDEASRRLFQTIMSASPVLLCQTEELRSFLEGSYPEVAGKCWLLPPAIPEGITGSVLPAPNRSNLELCYAGKFASRWMTHEMCDIPRLLAARGIEARLSMVGDKVNRDPDWPEFVPEMRRRLRESPGVTWVGGVSRESSIEIMSQCHVGLSWRSHELDDSLELSTKLLEYCAAGTLPLLNRTAMHERIFGTDYPLFVGSREEVIDRLASLTSDSDLYETALRSIANIADNYTLEKAGVLLDDLVQRQFPGLGLLTSPGTRVRVVGSAPSVFDALSQTGKLDVAHDVTPPTDQAEDETTIEAISGDPIETDLDVFRVSGPNARLRGSSPPQVARRTSWLLVVTSPTKRRLVESSHDPSREDIIAIPKSIDMEAVRRPKINGSRFHIGFFVDESVVDDDLGRAAQLVARLGSEDPRFVVFVRSGEDSLQWSDGLKSLWLSGGRQRLVFEDSNQHLTSWLRKIGFVVAFTSDPNMSVHVASGSGSVPVLLRRPGEESWYDDRWLHSSPVEMADYMVSTGRHEKTWSDASGAAAAETTATFGRSAVGDMWLSLIDQVQAS